MQCENCTASVFGSAETGPTDALAAEVVAGALAELVVPSFATPPPEAPPQPAATRASVVADITI
jgi:hypothetical protein